MQEVSIEIKNMYKNFGATHALTDVSFRFNKGEIRGLIGENGSGKSTVSSIIAGIQPPTSGEMFLFGKPWAPKTSLEAQNAGQGEQRKRNAVDDGGFSARPFPYVHAVGNDVLNDGDHRGQRGGAHEHEEQSAPETPAGHGVEHVGQGNENQSGAGIRLHAEGEAGGEDDET